MFPLHLLPELVKNLGDEFILRNPPPPPHKVYLPSPHAIISIISHWTPGSAASSDTISWLTLSIFLGNPRLF